MTEIPVAEISPNPRNPRERFDEGRIEELADSINEQGLLNPVLVRPRDDGYELVHGERRVRATEKLGGEKIRAEIRDLGDKEALEISITENLQREDVNPIEEARGFQSLIDEFDLTQAEAAEQLGKSRSHVANQLGLLNLPDELQSHVLHKTISPWMARTLNSVWGEYWLLDLVWDHDLSVTEAREIIDGFENGKEYASVTRDRPITVFEDSLSSTEELAELLDLSDERRELWASAEYHEWRHWAHQNIDGVDPLIPGLDNIPGREPQPGDHREEDKLDITPQPVVYDVSLQKIVAGYHRINLAREHYDYEGDIRVEYRHPRRFFEWDSCVLDDEELAALQEESMTA